MQTNLRLKWIDNSFTLQVFTAIFGKQYSIVCIDYYINHINNIILLWRVMEMQHC